MLSCQPGAYASHRSAAWLWGMLEHAGPVTHVTVAGRDPGSRDGAELHRVARLDRHDTTRFEGVPITSPVRTLLDLAASESQEELEAASAAALRLNRATAAQIEAGLTRGRRGAAKLRRVLTADPCRTRSRLERRMLRLVRQAELPPPQMNVEVLGWEVDLFWERQRVAVEVDSFGTHCGRGSFERDRRRDADLEAAGIAALRFSDRRIDGKPLAVVARLAAALAQAGGPTPIARRTSASVPEAIERARSAPVASVDSSASASGRNSA